MAQRRKTSRQPGAVQLMHDWLVAERPWKVLCAIVVVVIGVSTALMLGWGFIVGTGEYWQRPLYDAGAHFGGWLFFARDSWHFPVFDTYRAAFPDGTSIILTDSLPLIALVAKALGAGLLDNWNYFGLFVWASYVLNGVALLWLLRQLGVSNVLGAMAAVVFAVCCTLHNIQFESFFAHFVVIFSLGWYVRLTRNFRAKELAGFTAMVLASLLIHPYIFAMSAAVLVVTVAQLWRQKVVSGRQALVWLGAFGAALVAMVWVSGYVAREPKGFQDHLFGLAPTFALDLTAVFQRQYSSNEIGTYVGLGFWMIVLLGAWLMRRSLVACVRQHMFLVALCVALLLFSISTTFFFNGQTVLKISVPDAVMAIFEMFRASKRFIVPLFYLAVVIGLVWALRSKRQWAVGVVVAALLVQVVDTGYFLQSQATAARQGQPAALDADQLRSQLKDVERLNVYPSYSCLYGSGVVPISWEASLELQYVAATEHKITNSVRTSRRTQDCTAESIRAHLPPQPNTLNAYIREKKTGDFIFQPPKECVQRVDFKYGVYCRAE